MATKEENERALLALIASCDTNTFGDVQTSDGTITDVNGDTIPDGEAYVEDPDGDILCGAKAKPRVAADGEAGTGANGVDYGAGDTVIDFPGYGEICIPKKPVPDCIRAVRSTPLPRNHFDPDCFPSPDACDKEGDTYFDDGIGFEFINGVWEAVTVSPREIVRVMNDDPGGTTQWNDAQIGAVGGPAPIDVDCIEETYTNNDKVTVRVEADVRVMAQANSEVAGNLWTMQMIQDPAVTSGFSLNMGAPNSLLDTEGDTFQLTINPGDAHKEQQKDLLWSKWFAEIAPGASATLRVCYKLGTPQYVSHPNNTVDAVVLAGRFQVRRSC